MKKILSLMLAAVMCLSMMSAGVLAVEDDGDPVSGIGEEASSPEPSEISEDVPAEEAADESEEDSISPYAQDENFAGIPEGSDQNHDEEDAGDVSDETPEELPEDSGDNTGFPTGSDNVSEANPEDIPSDMGEAPAADGASTGLNVAYRTQEDIRRFALSHPVETAGTLYTENPVLEAPYDAGEVSDLTLDTALNALNLVRYIAGLSADVTLNDDYTALAQASALLQAANGRGLSHYPGRPAGISDDLYDRGYEGSRQSNLAASCTNLVTAVFHCWMHDGDSGNIDRVGHRRWILNPKMSQTGFGVAGSKYVMYAFDKGNSSETEMLVAWPAQNMPTALFGSDYPWSLSMDQPVAEGAEVTLTRNADGKTWTFSSSNADGYFSISNAGFGQEGCIIFRPKDIEYNAGDSFTVLITGAADDDIIYTVEFFDMDDLIYAYKNVSDVTIPDGMTGIGDYAFYDCTSLTSVAIPDSMTSIGDYAFFGCPSLTSVTIPDSVTSIGNFAFSHCTSLTSAAIPDSVTSIGSHAFFDCSSLTSVNIPDGVTSIGDRAFTSCKSLTSVTIPDGVTRIGERAFALCSHLSSITLPDSLAEIGKSAFYYCISLESITIPDHVTTIEDETFDSCSSLESITIPASVESIGKHVFYAFAGYTYLKDVYYAGTEEQWNAIAIDADNEGLSKATIHFNVSPGSDAADILEAAQILQAVVGIRQNPGSYSPADAAKILSGLV